MDRKLARRRAMVLVAMDVNEHTMMDSSAITARVNEMFGADLTGGQTASILRGMASADLVVYRYHYGNDPKGTPNHQGSARKLTAAGRYAAETMSGLLEGDDGE